MAKKESEKVDEELSDNSNQPDESNNQPDESNNVESSELVVCIFKTDHPAYSAKKGDEKLMQVQVAEQLAHYGVVEILKNDQ